MDSPGCSGVCSECCVKQSTVCVAPRPGFKTSTCCSRWAVGCSVGTVGCCDPARPWQFMGAAPSSAGFAADAITNAAARRPMLTSRAMAKEGAAADDSTTYFRAQGTGGDVAFALFTKVAQSTLQALTIDAKSGNVTGRADVTGPAADYYSGYFGETTRLFPFDPKGARFVFADLDMSSAELPLVLYTIDAATGKSASARIDGCGTGKDAYPFGLAFDAAKGMLSIGMQTEANATLCSVDIDAATGSLAGSVPREGSEASPSFYSAYLSLVDAGTAYRIGHQQVTQGTGDGLGVTNFGAGSTTDAATTWHAVPTIKGHALPTSIGPHPSGKGFISLAPRTASTDADAVLDIVSWELGGAARVVANLSNAHQPTMPFLGVLGYVGDSVSGDKFGAMVVATHPYPIDPGLLDRWVVVTYDASSGGLTEAELSPQPTRLGAEAVALSGFGLVSTA